MYYQLFNVDRYKKFVIRDFLIRKKKYTPVGVSSRLIGSTSNWQMGHMAFMVVALDPDKDVLDTYRLLIKYP